MMQDLVIHIVFISYAIGVLLTFGTILTWVERKQAAIMSDRIGANRAYIRLPFTQVKLVWLGLFHGIADGLKMLLKEDFHPDSYDRFAYAIAPWVVFTPVLLVFAVIPFGGTLEPATLLRGVPVLSDWFGERTYALQIAQLDAGLLVVFAFGGITIIGAMLAGWSSNNKFSLLGALRAGSQMISYEVVMGLTVLGLILIYGTVDLRAIAEQQSGVLLGFLPAWGIFLQPFAAILFLVAAIAENKRIPFDLPEAESELIAGYFTEYSAMKMGLFMFAEFIEIAIIGALFTTLFLGGYNLPFMTDAGFVLPGGHVVQLPHAAVVVIQLVVFLAKVFLMCSFQILVRWSLPRFRYDQLLSFAWKFMFPLALANLTVTAVALWASAGHRGPHETLSPQAILEPPHDVVVGARLHLRDHARAADHRPHLHAQHVALDDGAQGRAHHLLPRTNAPRLRRAQPRQTRSHAAPERQAAVHRLQPVRDRVPREGDRDRGRVRPRRPGPPEVSGALRDRLLALHLLRALRRGLP